MARRSQIRGRYVSIAVNDSIEFSLSDIAEALDDEDVRMLAAERLGVGDEPPFDALLEIECLLLRNKPNAALALVQSMQNARKVPDDYRARQLAEIRAQQELH